MQSDTSNLTLDVDSYRPYHRLHRVQVTLYQKRFLSVLILREMTNYKIYVGSGYLPSSPRLRFIKRTQTYHKSRSATRNLSKFVAKFGDSDFGKFT